MTNATSPIKDDASKVTPAVSAPDVKKDEPSKVAPASTDKK